MILLALSTIALMNVSAAQPLPSYNAPLVSDLSLLPGSIFYIDVNVTDAVDLWGYTIVLSFDPTILLPTDYMSYAPFVLAWPSEIGYDYVTMSYSMQLGDKDGVNGFALLARIDFMVVGTGWSDLDLHDSVYLDVEGVAMPHEDVDGLFANIEPAWSANLVRRSAWPEHHSWVEAKDENLTLTGRVRNLGTLPVKAKVVFTIKYQDGLWQTEVETETAVLRPRQMKDLAKLIDKDDLNAAIGYYGRYSVSARCWYDSDFDGTLDAQGAKLKSFGFAFKP